MQMTGLLKILIDADSFLTIDELVEMTGQSRRTLYYLISDINNNLDEESLEPIKNSRGIGYMLPNDTKRQLTIKFGDDKLSKLSPIKFVGEERRFLDFLILFLMPSKVTIDSIVKIEHVTKNTVIKDLKLLKIDLQDNGINIKSNIVDGHVLIGDELDIRKYLVNQIMLEKFMIFQFKHRNLISEITNYKNDITLNLMVNEWLQQMERSTKKSFSDTSIQRLEIILPLIIKRITLGYTLNNFSSDSNNLIELKEYKLIKNFLSQIDVELVKNDSEIFFIEQQFLSSQLNVMNNLSDSDILFTITEQIVDQFQFLSGIVLKDRMTLIHSLYVHITSCYYRVKYDSQYVDESILYIKDQYPDVFSYTQLVLHRFEEYCEKSLNNYEIALIAVYFGAQLITNNNFNLVEKHDVLVVCSNGIGTSKMLMQQLKQMYVDIDFYGPITKREYDQINIISEKIVITTINLQEKNKPIIIVKPILKNSDVIKIDQLLTKNKLIKKNRVDEITESLLDVISEYTKIIDFNNLKSEIKNVLYFPQKFNNERNDQPLLSELLTKNTIKFEKSNNINWQDALLLASKPLLDNGSIKTDYVDAMIDSVNKNGPYINIGDNVALGHARPEQGVKKLSLSALFLDESINLVDENHPIRLIIILAAVDDNSHLQALSELAQLLGNKESFNELMNSKNTDEVIETILKGEV